MVMSTDNGLLAAVLDEPAASSSASFYSHDTGMDPGDQQDNFPRPMTANPFKRSRIGSTSAPWHRRPKSLVLDEHDFPRRLSELAIEDGHHDNEAPKSADSLKGKIRRASLSLKGIVRRDRRGSEPVTDGHNARPTTSHKAWHKLRQAASFRHSRTSYGNHGNLETIYSPVETDFPRFPVPGNSLAPPFIPRHTGAAAKASAAWQNEHARFYQDAVSFPESQNDRESGIGIPLASTSQINVPMEQGASVIKRDFITQLPSELAVQILSYLNAAQLVNASMVSRDWFAAIQDQYIWRQSFLSTKTSTFATGLSIQPGTGAGVPTIRPGNNWRKIYRAREELDKRWRMGKQACAVFLNGHMDSVYCQQFDEYELSLI